MSNVLGVRLMSNEQYKELKDNGTVTGNGHTITDEADVLNITPDTTESQIAELNQEIVEVKDQVANAGGKMYLHTFTIEVTVEERFYFNVYSSKSTMFESFIDFCEAIGVGTGTSNFYPCFHTYPNVGVTSGALVRYFSETSGLFLTSSGVEQKNLTGIDTVGYKITEV